MSGWLRVSDYTGGLDVTSGDILNVRITFSAELQGGSGTDDTVVIDQVQVPGVKY